MNREQVGLARIASPVHARPAPTGAHGVEPDDAALQAPRLALHPNDSIAEVEQEVIAVVVPDRQEHGVPELHKRVGNGHLGSKADIDGVGTLSGS
ncbi:MAG TPA: hypothetical protein VGO71_19930 [Baekduia sp.]|nr:hypothetical protein [Baekduia sp.]